MRRRRLRLGGPLATAAALIALAGVQTAFAARCIRSSRAALIGEAVQARGQDRTPVTASELERLIRSREKALAWRETGRLWTDLALARLMLLERRRVIRADVDLAPVRDALRRGLMLAPANPYGWTRLAAVESASGAAMDRLAAHVRMAILTGPYERPLLFARLELALAVWPEASAEDRRRIAGQIRWAWCADRQSVLAAAGRAEAAEAVRSALAGWDEGPPLPAHCHADPGQTEVTARLLQD